MENEQSMAYSGKYDSPEDLLNDQTLSRDVKIKLLERVKKARASLQSLTAHGSTIPGPARLQSNPTCVR